MTPLPSDLLDLPAEIAARRVALHFLDEAAAAFPRLERPDDPEALHDFRVGLRRLRSTLRSYAPQLDDALPRRLRRRLRRLARATGASRDAEVHAEWLAAQRHTLDRAEQAGADALATWLEDEKREAERALEERVMRRFPRLRRRLAKRLRRYTRTIDVEHMDAPATYAAATAALLDTLAAELQRCASAVHGIDDQETAHEARIAGKRLRYALEPLEGQVEGVEEVVKQLKRFQDALGEMHDAHVFSARITRLAAHAGDPHDARGAHDASDSPADDVPATRHGLEALAERLHARRDESFEAARAWIGDPGPGELLTAVWRIGQRLAARGRQDVEIERKYLLRALPEEAALAAAKEVEQGYLPGERLVERVRRVRDVATERYYRTVKLGSGVRRVEVEEEAPRELFEALWALTGGRRVSKRRHAVADGALTWEIDAFTDRDLVLAEVELPDADTAVVLPGWLAPYVVREVTDEPEFVNARLAR